MENTDINIIFKIKNQHLRQLNGLELNTIKRKKLDEAYMQEMRDRSNLYYAAKRPYEQKKEMKRLKEFESYFPKVITE